MILITSGAYIQPEFVAEVGLLPPAFLPIGGRRLYQHQLKQLSAIVGKRYISIPISFEIDDDDLVVLNNNEVTVIGVPDGLSLGQSIVYCWNSIATDEGPLRILHGDTLIYPESQSDDSDFAAVAINKGYYSRGKVDLSVLGEIQHPETEYSEDNDLVLAGYFAIAAPRQFVKEITRANGDFIIGLGQYALKRTMTAVKISAWLDFGHINTYFRSRATLTTQRAFNEMSIDTRIVSKSSTNLEKINAEADWYEKIPPQLRIYTTPLVGRFSDGQRSGYQLEYLYLCSLSDIFVFGRLPPSFWTMVRDSCYEFLTACKSAAHQPTVFSTKNFDALYLPKTLRRLKQFSERESFDISRPLTINNKQKPSLLALATLTASGISETQASDIVISHGDFGFSNILYDTRAMRIKVIDPRGIDETGSPSIYGDRRYDIAKLYHSVVGLYDVILAGRCYLNVDVSTGNIAFDIPERQSRNEIESVFSPIFKCAGEAEILCITIHLFISMLPLHADDKVRQMALLCNAYRLFDRLTALKNPGKIS